MVKITDAERNCLESLLQRMHRDIDAIEGKPLEGQELQDVRCLIAMTNALEQFLSAAGDKAASTDPLPQEEVDKIQRLEHELSDDMGEEVLLVAYRSGMAAPAA